MAKSKNLRPALAAQWRKHNSVGLGNQTADDKEDQWVVSAWVLPSVMNDVTFDDENLIFEAVSKGEWRQDVRAANWVGNCIADVLDINISKDADDDKDELENKKQGRERIKRILTALIKRGVLKVEEKQDPKTRKKFWMVVAGKTPVLLLSEPF